MTMMDVKQISICDEPDCECCALDRKIMEALGDASVISQRTVAMAHAMARTFYAHYRATGDLDDVRHQAGALKFLTDGIIRAMGELRRSDKVMQ